MSTEIIQRELAETTTHELAFVQTDQVGGGNDFVDAFEVGWMIGTYIDRHYILPLWY